MERKEIIVIVVLFLLALGFSFYYNNLNEKNIDSVCFRHSLMEETDLDIEDALFFLSSCSGFINYLTEKSVKAGIKF